MKQNIKSFLLKVLRDQNAQVLPLMAITMVGFLAMAAAVADVGDVYYSYNELVSSTNAAALAGAIGLPTSGTKAEYYAGEFNAASTQSSSQTTYTSAGANRFGNLNITGYTATLGCISSSVGANTPCIATGIGSTTANAIQITQTAKVKTYFAAIFGTPYVTLTATSSALMGSPNSIPRNVALIMDTTASMGDADSNCGSGQTRLSCAFGGIKTLLQGMHPCSAEGCGTLNNGVYQNSLDVVSLFTFPEMTNSSQQQYETDCKSSTNPSITPYTFPSRTATTYTPGQNGQAAADYQVTPYLSNYQSGTDTDGAVNLNGTGSSASGVVDAVAQGGCAAGMGDPGGEGTYYAGVLYAAQASLEAEKLVQDSATGLSSQNVIIIVSDGAATASQSQMSGATANGDSTGYGSYKNECKQSVTAAQAIQKEGTVIYSVAYGSPTTGCTTDSGVYTSPCYSMQQMASTSNGTTYFYSDNAGGTGSCTSGAAPSSLSDIFGAIVASWGPARLVPNSTFSPSS